MKKNIPTSTKKLSLTIFFFVFLSFFSLSQVDIVVNSFEETAADTWTPLVFSTPTCTNGSDRWDYSTSLSSIAPNDGLQFWGIQDLDGNCGGASYESITFPEVNISAYSSVTITFDYYTIGYEGVDDLGYEVWEDGVKVVDDVSLNDNSSGWLTVTHSVTASVTNVYLVLKAKQNGGSDYGAFDNVKLRGVSASPTPTITVSSSMSDYGSQCLNTESTEQTYTVEGSNLTADIAIAAPTHFEISTSSGSGFTNNLTLTQSGGAVSATTIYVHFKPTVAGAQSGDISHTSTGATTVNENVSGTGKALAIPSVTTTVISNITSSSADGGGNVTDDNCAIVTARGICWNIAGTPTIADAKTVDGSGTGVFVSPMTGLTDGQTYYVRAYATNSQGTAYGTEETFVAQDLPCVDEDFIDFSDWINSGTAIDNVSSHYGDAAPCRAFGTGDNMITPPVDNPQALTFYQDASSGGNGNTATIDYKIGAGAWTSCYSFTVSSSGNTEVVDLTNVGGVDLTAETDVTFRFNSTFNTWYLDDVTIQCYSCSGLAPITQASNITFSNIGFSSLDVSWTNGDGGSRIVIMNTSNSFTDPSNGDDPAGNSTWLNSGEQVVYNGTGSSFTVDGLDETTTYWFRVYEFNCTGSNTVFNTSTATNNPNSTATVACADPTTQASDITFANITETTMDVSWTLGNGDGCLVIMNTSNSFTAPIDGTTYVGNTTYGGSGEQVIYVGSGSTVSIDGLTIGTEYWFAVYESNCSGASIHYMDDLSSAADNPINQTTIDFTTLERGDIAVVGVCSNIAACQGGSNGDDEISIVCFKDIKPGTTLDLTDNGWQRVNANEWGNSEGYLRIKRTGATILAGTVITFRLNNSGAAYTGVFPDNDWSIEEDYLSLVLNSNGDQIYFMQDGVWDGGTSSGTHDATYTGGNYLFAFNTNDAWNDFIDDTQESGLITDMDCTSMMPGVASDYLKYTGPIDSCSQVEWIGRINDSGNWTSYSNCTEYYAGLPNYTGGDTLPINNVGIDANYYWYGNKNTDWFDCANWGTLKIPTAAHTVIIPNSNQVDTGIVLLAGEVAACKNFEIHHADYFIKGEGDATKVLDVGGNVRIVRGLIDFDDDNDATPDGTIRLTRHWVNDSVSDAFLQGNSNVIFDGSIFNQRIYSLNNYEHFGSLTMNNTVDLDLNGNAISVDGILDLTSGNVITGSDTIIVLNTDVNAIVNHSVNSNVFGYLRRDVNTAGSYDFPMGHFDAVHAFNPSSHEYLLGNINLNSSAGISSLTASFSSHPGSVELVDGGGIPLPLTVNGSQLTEMLNFGFWTISPDNSSYTVDYDVVLTSQGHTNGGSDAQQHTIIKREDGVSAWEAFEANHNNATQSGTGTAAISAQLSSLLGFSDMAIARNAVFPLPVNLLYFTAREVNEGVCLEWATASEINNEGFFIEHSGADFVFEKATFVNGFGNSSSMVKYQFIDKNPVKGLNYYKLIQQDYNGSKAELEIETININQKLNYTIKSQQLELKLGDADNEDVLIEIYNSIGQKTVVSKGVDSNVVLVDLSHLPQNAVYIIRIKNGSNEEFIKYLN